MTDSDSGKVARSAGRMGAATLISRVLGLAREQVFAYFFGASNAMDAFNIAFRIPNLLRDLFAEGAMSAAFVPNFTATLLKSREDAFKLLAGVLSVLVVTVTAISAIGMVLSAPLVSLYAGSYHDVAGKFEMAVELTRLMFPFFPLVAMAAVLMGALNSLGFYFLPAVAPALFNVASIVCGFTVVPVLAHYTGIPPIYGMGGAVLLGGFLQFYVQWVQIRRQGFVPGRYLDIFMHPLRVKGVKQVLFLLIPGTVGLAATQLGILINSIYATSAGSGAVSWLNYAFRLMQFPIGIFGVSLAAAALPQVSRKLAQGDAPGAGQEVNQALRMTFAVNGPAAAGLMAIGLPIVQLLFQHGRFTLEDSQQTAAAVFWYALGLPGYSAVKVLVPVFYALGTTRVPVMISFAMVALIAALNHVFLDILHYPFWCLAAATSASATLNAMILGGWLAAKIPGSVDLKLLRATVLHGLVSAGVGAGAWASLRLVAPLEAAASSFTAGRFVFWSVEVALGMAVGFALWWCVGLLLKIPEHQRVAQFALKKLRRTG